jgi:hypothetical protein
MLATHRPSWSQDSRFRTEQQFVNDLQLIAAVKLPGFRATSGHSPLLLCRFYFSTDAFSLFNSRCQGSRPRLINSPAAISRLAEA